MLTVAPDGRPAESDETGLARSPERQAVKLPAFVVISGTGWLIDFTVFNVLVALSLPIFSANLCGATCGVSFVFFAGRQFIFREVRTGIRTAILCYTGWNVVAILLMSLAIATLGHALAGPSVQLPAQHFLDSLRVPLRAGSLAPVVAKMALTPVSMYLNFVAMGVILERRLHLF